MADRRRHPRGATSITSSRSRWTILAYRVSIFLSSRLLYTAITIFPVIAVFIWFREFHRACLKDPMTWPFSLSRSSWPPPSSSSSPTRWPCWPSGFWKSPPSSSSFIPLSTISAAGFSPSMSCPTGCRPSSPGCLLPTSFIFPWPCFMEKVRGAELVARPRHPGRLGGHQLCLGPLDVAPRHPSLRIGRRLTRKHLFRGPDPLGSARMWIIYALSAAIIWGISYAASGRVIERA